MTLLRRRSIIRERASQPEEENRVGSWWFRFLCFFSMASIFVSVGFYLFLVNQNVVSGYSMRIAEKRVTEVSNEFQKLRIREAELRSLYGLEDASARLDMVPIQDAVSLEEHGSIAYR